MQSPTTPTIVGLVTAGLVLVGCSDLPTSSQQDPADAGQATLQSLASNPNATPITYVSTFAAFVGIDVKPHGNSGRTQERNLELVFDVTGDLVGTATATLTNNNGIDRVGFATSHQDFVLEVCWPARALCGEFAGKSAGKITGEGIDFPISIGHGSGGFAGMTLRGQLLECPDSNGDKGCFSGYLLE